MPLVSRIVEIDGQKLLDGGIADSIPVKYFESIGYDKNVVVLTRPKGYRKEKNSVMSLVRRQYRNYPKFVETMANRYLMYNEELDYIAEEEAEGKLFVIRPEQPIPVGHVEKDPEKLRLAYEMGRSTAEKCLPELQTFLGEH